MVIHGTTRPRETYEIFTMQAANKFKVTGVTLSSLLCIYLKGMQEGQPLILTNLRDYS